MSEFGEVADLTVSIKQLLNLIWNRISLQIQSLVNKNEG